MYVITNRQVFPKASGLRKFGKDPNQKGSNELRVAEVSKEGAKWDVDILPDKLGPVAAAQYITSNRLPLNKKDQHYASLKVACEVVSKARRLKRNILFFVHGYNNDMKDTLTRALDFENRYQVVCLVFSWPANGGGAIRGTASYKADKRDARASAGALERTLMIMHKYFQLLTESTRTRLYDIARHGDKKKKIRGHKDNAIKRDELYAQLLEEDCPFTVNAIFHSMGNYVLKQSLKSSISEGNNLLFDNILLVAADTNSKGHDAWVEKLRVRNRCYVAINEKDFALGASRAKGGSEQLERLGHSLNNLVASNARYVNFTGVDRVGKSHGYFGDPSKGNPEIFAFFKAAFDGEAAEKQLTFNPAGNWYDF